MFRFFIRLLRVFSACEKVWRRMAGEYFAVMKGEMEERAGINFNFAILR